MKPDIRNRSRDEHHNTAIGCVRILGDIRENITRTAVTTQGQDHE